MLCMQLEQLFHFLSDKWEGKDGNNVTLVSVRGHLMAIRLRKVLRRDLKEEVELERRKHKGLLAIQPLLHWHWKAWTANA